MNYTILKSAADQIANETATEANTAQRIGTWMQNALAWMSEQLRGKSDSLIAGSILPWPGTVSTVPVDYMPIPQVQTWLLISDYPDLYNNLGGLNSLWGVNVTTGKFSLPFIPPGYTIVQTGTGYELAKTGGEEKHQLTVDELPKHRVRISLADGDAGTPEWQSPDYTSRRRWWCGRGDASEAARNAGYSDYTGGDAKHNNMPPYIALNWIIKLKNTNNSFTASIDADGHLILTFSDGSTQDAGVICSNAVRFDKEQNLSASEKTLARDNISAASKDDLKAQWGLSGNEGTVAGTNFIGTTDDVDVVFKRNGSVAGWLSSQGKGNTALGTMSLNPDTNTGVANSAVGVGALFFNTTGKYNTAVGQQTLLKNTTGNNNTAVGNTALKNVTAGSYNNAYGVNALLGLTFGNYNVANGNSALIAVTVGESNVGLGYYAGKNITTGSYNITIGRETDVPDPTANNQLNIGNSIYGKNMGQTTPLIGIGTPAPAYPMDVNGVVRASGFINSNNPYPWFITKNDGSVDILRSGSFLSSVVYRSMNNIAGNITTIAAMYSQIGLVVHVAISGSFMQTFENDSPTSFSFFYPVAVSPGVKLSGTALIYTDNTAAPLKARVQADGAMGIKFTSSYAGNNTICYFEIQADYLLQ
jgi:microcystin-dependent protein